ncbi:MAG: DUF4276 family protein [Nitrospirae bacterium]|nr:DUF4276 family protein [Nitrospirota bacterium]
MSKRALILVEGQTEERFVKDVLSPAFWESDLFFSSTLLVTKRVKDGPNFKGGVTNFAKFENDVERLLIGAAGAMVTTLIDYYGLPADFPGMGTRPNGPAIQRVQHVEAAVQAHFGHATNFLPFFTLHEFEAWLFASTDVLPRAMTQPEKGREMAAVLAEFASPEDINERPEHAPSKRIKALFPAYRKTVHGPMVASRIGLATIRRECNHFAWWISELENYAAA